MYTRCSVLIADVCEGPQNITKKVSVASTHCDTFWFNMLAYLTRITESCREGRDGSSPTRIEIHTLEWKPADMRALLQQRQNIGIENENGKKKVRLRGKKSNHNQALTIVESMWGNVNSCPTSSEKKDSGPRHIRDATAHLAARANNKSVETDLCPYSKNRVPSATLHHKDTEGNLNTWLEGLRHREEKPTDQQLEILQTIVDRIETEAAVEQSWARPSCSTSTPLFDMAHGQPGCGKSRLIAWIREAFEEVLGWQHGVQFVCLAFQNTMVGARAAGPLRVCAYQHPPINMQDSVSLHKKRTRRTQYVHTVLCFNC